jgi:hypothetical protein
MMEMDFAQGRANSKAKPVTGMKLELETVWRRAMVSAAPWEWMQVGDLLSLVTSQQTKQSE